MVKNLVIQKLSVLLSKHFKGINENTLELALLSGTCTMKNLELKTENIQKYFNYKVDSIFIGSVTLKYSLLSLLYKPIEVFINNLKVSINKNIVFKKEDFIYEKLKFIEKETEKTTESSTISGLISQFYEKAIVRFNDIEVIFNSKNGDNGEDKTDFSIAIDSINTLTADENWKESDEFEDMNIYYKIFTVSNFRIIENQTNVINPLDLKCRVVVRKGGSDEDSPDIKVDFKIPEFNAVINVNFYGRIVNWINTYNFQKTMKNIIKNHLHLFDVYNQDELGNMDKFSTVMNILKNNPKPTYSEEERTTKFAKYYDLYQKFTTNKINEDEMKELTCFEENEDVDFILSIRRKILKDKELIPKRRFFFWTQQVTKDEKEKICKDLQIKEINEKVESFQISISVEKLGIDIVTEKHVINIQSENICLKHNSLKDRTNCILKSVNINYNSDFLLKSYNQENFAFMNYEKSKLKLSYNHLDLKKLFVIKNIFIDFLKYKIETFFDISSLEISKIIPEKFEFLLETNTMHYFSDSNSNIVIINSFEINGNLNQFQLASNGLLLDKNGIKSQIIDCFNTIFKFSKYKKQFRFQIQLQEITIYEDVLLQNSKELLEEILLYDIQNRKEQPGVNLDIEINLTLERINLNHFKIIVRNLNFSAHNDIYNFKIKNFEYKFAKILNFNLEYNKRLELKHIETIINLSKLDIINIRQDYDFIKRCAIENIKKDMEIPSERNFLFDNFEINQVSVVILDKLDVLNVIIGKVTKDRVYKAQIIANKTQVYAETISFCGTGAIIDGLKIHKHKCTIKTISDILKKLEFYEIIPLVNSDKPTVFDLEIKNIIIENYNITNFPHFLIACDFVRVNLCDIFECSGMVRIDIPNDVNDLQISFDFIDSKPIKQGSTLIKGTINTEFTKTIIFTLFEIIDIIVICLDSIILSNNSKSVINWVLKTDLQLINSLDNEHLLNLYGDINILSESGNRYIAEMFDTDKELYNYNHGEKIHLLSHEHISRLIINDTLGYSVISIRVVNFVGTDQNNNFALFLDEFKGVIIKNMFAIYINFDITKMFAHTKIYKIFFLKYFYIPFNLSYGQPTVNLEVSVKGTLNRLVYKNIIAENISINGNQVKFAVSSFIEMQTYMHEYENKWKKCTHDSILCFDDFIKDCNIIQSPANVSLIIIGEPTTTRYNIDLNDIFIINGDVYYEFIQYFNLVMSDLDLMSTRIEKKEVNINLFFIECRLLKILMHQKFLVCVEYMRAFNNQSKIEGCIISHLENASNYFLEKYFLSFEYENKILNVNGHENMRAKFNKAFLFEKNKKKFTYNNFSDLNCTIFFDEIKINECEDITVNQFYNSKFTILLIDKVINYCIKTETYEISYNRNIYLVDIVVRDDRINLRIFNNIIFKNYTDYKLCINIGNQDVNSKNYLDTFKVNKFGDSSYSHHIKEVLYFNVYNEGIGESSKPVKFTEGIYVCDVDRNELSLICRSDLVFRKDEDLKIFCTDVVNIEKNGYNIVYVFIYVPYLINNCTGIDFSFKVYNSKYDYTKEINLTSSTENFIIDSVKLHDCNRLPSNTAFIPYQNFEDTVKITFNNRYDKFKNIYLGINSDKKKEIILPDNHKYGVIFEQKERLLQGLKYKANIYEVIIYPFYIINNNLKTEIYLEKVKINPGKNYINLLSKRSKLILSESFQTKTEINFDAIELFSILKLNKRVETSSVTKHFSQKNVFQALKKYENRRRNSNDLSIDIFYSIESISLYKNIALEMRYGNGKYANTHILNFNYANVVKNSTNYTFMISVGGEVIILRPGQTREIHFGSVDFFYIFFVDEFGFQEVAYDLDYDHKFVYYKFQDKMYKIRYTDSNYLENFGRYIHIKGLSPKYFFLKREERILFKLITFINGKQRNIEIVVEKTWPIKIINETDCTISVSQVGSSQRYNIEGNNSIHYCYDSLYKEKYLVIVYNHHKIKFATNDEVKIKHGLVISSYRLNDVTIIEICNSKQKIDVPVNTLFEINFCIPIFSLSICDKREIICIHARNLEMSIKKVTVRNQERLIYDITGSSIQIDDQGLEPNFPIVLNAKLKDFNMLNNQANGTNKFFRIYLEITENKYKCLKRTENTMMDYFKWRIICFSFLLQEFYLRIDEILLNTMFKFFNEREKFKFIYQCSYCESIVCRCHNNEILPCKYILIDSFLINPIVFSISFRKSDVESGIYKKALILLAKNISDFKVKLDAEFLTNIDNPILSVREVVANHYKTQAYSGMFKVLLSVDFLGNIGSFTDTFSMGIKDLFYEPFLGLKDEDPKKFSLGLLRGGKSLVKHTVSGLSGVFSKISDGISKNLGLVTFDKEFQNYNRNLYSGYFDDITLHIKDPEIIKSPAFKPIIKGYDRFIDSISSGVSGIVEKPFEGAKKGMVGFVKGVGKGAIGLIAKPTVGLFDMIGGMADGIKSGMDGGRLCRLQYPRFDLNGEFDYEQNMSYYIYMKYITVQAPKFVYGEFKDDHHLILTKGILFVFSKSESLEINIHYISLITSKGLVYEGKEIIASSKLTEILKIMLKRYE